ncbi:MAG: hypothetical protein NT154_00255 [Verrucomicrobia bacterium]|nr:hypothetical protein [Verrucomicrobiota bacterium]
MNLTGYDPDFIACGQQGPGVARHSAMNRRRGVVEDSNVCRCPQRVWRLVEDRRAADVVIRIPVAGKEPKHLALSRT